MRSRTLLPFSARVLTRSRGYLPHWEVDDAIYFITYRLADSLPLGVVERLTAERRADCERGIKPSMAKRRFGRRMNRYLRVGYGECHLRDETIAKLVINAWQHFDNERYRLMTWCVMPNHVHVIMRLFVGSDLAKVLHSWKSYTANLANSILGRTGTFWCREYYDRCIRDERELLRTVRYVRENPAKAGLRDWPYVECAGW
jgi:REP element-mobilizing transposase RayT